MKSSQFMRGVLNQTVPIVVAQSTEDWAQAERSWAAENPGVKRGGHSLRRGGKNNARRKGAGSGETNAVASWKSNAGGAYDEWVWSEKIGFSVQL